jgi:probable F420-dependent oxidoreductase
MDIGVFQILPDAEADPAKVAKRAEELGFDSYWVPEHPVYPVKGTFPYPGGAPDAPPPDYLWKMPDPFIALSRASAVTEKIKLGTGICLVPERNPLMLAKEIASLDSFSGGRFLFGIGAGWHKEECEIMGGDFDHRWGQTKESILAMKELWTQDESEYHGKYYDFPPVKSYPKPANTPHPPVIMGGVSAQRVFKRVVEWGDGWMPLVESVDDIAAGVSALRQYSEEAGRDPSTINVTAFSLPGQWETGDDVQALEQAGANRMVLWLGEGNLEQMYSRMETLAAAML